jgi:hypothetical protein
MNWNDINLNTYEDLLNIIKNISSPEEAQEFLLAYTKINPDAKEVIGWMIGDVDRDLGRKIIDWFGCQHPVFGKTFPTSEEALKKGIEAGTDMKIDPALKERMCRLIARKI